MSRILWWRDPGVATTAIRARRAKLKILLKTRDEAHFLDQWIRHHATIVGLDNLIIFDNRSSDPAVKQILARYQPELLVIKFRQNHNVVHNVSLVPELYDALADSCDHFVFLDTDEFLVLIRGHHYYANTLVVDYISDFPEATTFPATWLWCRPRFADVFSVGTDRQLLADGICWGKPVLSTQLKLRGYINHNVQLRPTYYSDTIPGGLFTLHRAHLSAAQRIATNMRKLASRRFCKVDDPIDQVIGRDVSKATDPNVRLYVSEIAQLRDVAEPDLSESVVLVEGEIHLLPDSSIHFFSEREMFQLFELLQADAKFFRNALRHD